MKILCMCQHGHNRSQCLAYILSHDYDQETLAIGWQTADEELKSYLFKWADKIIVMQPHMVEKVPANYHLEKVLVCDVGVDIYGSPRNLALEQLCKYWLKHDFIPNNIK